mmetsp:Transcript_54463/g.129808  ORF Transcript_54463/g.129808 Transcript_54463/m.129808 type:complete len:501 (+) Transcript_54463:153-1655(+)|eukprot:CAMPEP_0178412820 /NCGR_PEP_ID=MMETSP0689_2-20121128/22212_1 /TAXON_ID=160604 /ORGANISM="Amphidinium massartii, Strain CS-259" /LENGTH=500 /DNA_ID=CAMNT_0020034079 /DNA_START=74 /DNA_END=1576 /DNA_ORIENTATION=-
MAMLGFEWMTFILAWFICAQAGKFSTLSAIFLRRVCFVLPAGTEWLKFEKHRKMPARQLQQGFKAQMSSGGLELTAASDYILCSLPFYEQAEILLQNLFVAVVVHVAFFVKWLSGGGRANQFVSAVALLLPLYQLSSMLWQVNELSWHLATLQRFLRVSAVAVIVIVPLLWCTGPSCLFLTLPHHQGGLLDLDLETSASQWNVAQQATEEGAAKNAALQSLLKMLTRWLAPSLAVLYGMLCLLVEGTAAFKADSALHVGLPFSEDFQKLVSMLQPPRLVSFTSAVLPFLAPTLWIPALSTDFLEGSVSPCTVEIGRNVLLVVFSLCRFLTVPSSVQFTMLENARPSPDAKETSEMGSTVVKQMMVWLFHFLAFPATILLLALHGLNTAVVASCSTGEDVTVPGLGEKALHDPTVESSAARQRGIVKLREAFAGLAELVPPEAMWRSVQSFMVFLLLMGVIMDLAGTLMSRAAAFESQVDAAKTASNLAATEEKKAKSGTD